jgi:GR25 family glycosyltransferase involved in LPS biosynthesis
MSKALIESIKEYKFMNIKIINDPKNIGINEFLKKIYIINLFEDIQKRNYINILFKKYKINYNLIIVDRIDKKIYDKLVSNGKISVAELGCCMSHMWCLFDIIKNNYENAVIFEDDIILSKSFIPSFLSIFKRKPQIDFLMLGAHDYNFSKTHFKNVKDGLYRPNPNCKNLFGAHANFYSNLGAKKMLNIRLTNLSFFDNEYNLLFDTLPNSYICYPNLVIANVSKSSINHEKAFFSEQEIGYYNMCFNNINLNDYNLIYINLLDLSLLNKNDTVESFIHRCLKYKFNNDNKSSFILKRFVKDFFTIDDLKKILSKKSLISLSKLSSNQSLIEPNNLSKK